MKKYCILALTIVLTAALFTGCGCTNRNAGGATSAPTLMPTTETTMPTTEATTVPTTNSTVPSTQETIDNGNGPVENTPNGTNGNGATGNGAATEGTVEGRAIPPTNNNKVG
ncbi:MAG: hypothetical protein ACI3V4_09910 [Faecousia sp.]